MWRGLSTEMNVAAKLLQTMRIIRIFLTYLYAEEVTPFRSGRDPVIKITRIRNLRELAHFHAKKNRQNASHLIFFLF